MAVESVTPINSKSPQVDALYKQLKEKHDKLQAQLAPYRETYERLVNDPKLLEARKMIIHINRELGLIQNELAAIARGNGSKGIQVGAGEYKDQK